MYVLNYYCNIERSQVFEPSAVPVELQEKANNERKEKSSQENEMAGKTHWAGKQVFFSVSTQLVEILSEAAFFTFEFKVS